VVLPVPSWLSLLAPQHCSRPLLSRAQLWVWPVVTAVAVETPTTATGDDELPTPVLVPSWPEELSPQQRRAPDDSTAQLVSPPALMPVAVLMPVTVTGVFESLKVLLPRPPAKFAPQQR